MRTVRKYGGSSVDSPEKIKRIAREISEAVKSGQEMVVVVSAMGHTTDELLSLAHQVAPTPSRRELDMLLTAGERISMALLSMALETERVSAISFTGSQSGIVTDSNHSRARILRILGDRIRTALQDQKVVIVAGFQGVSAEREITTLGRGGSDTTAVALAAALQADRCEIYTDVDQVASSDPRRIPKVRFYKEISKGCMEAFAAAGAQVLHARSVRLAALKKVSLWVGKSGANPETSGTWCVDAEEGGEGMEQARVLGVAVDESKVFGEVELARASASQAFWDLVSQKHFEVFAVSQEREWVRFFALKEALGEWRADLQNLLRDGFLKKVQFDEGIHPISVVGEGLALEASVLARSLGVLARVEVFPEYYALSSHILTFAVLRNRVQDAMEELHAYWIDGEGMARE